MSPPYLVKLKIAQKQSTAYCTAFCWTDCSEFLQKVVKCLFLSSIVTKFLKQLVWQQSFTFLWVFVENLSSNSIWLILTYKLKFNCRNLRRVALMTLSSYQVSKLRVILKYSCLFHWCKNYKSRLRIASVIVENKVAPFSPDTGVDGDLI